MRVVAWSLVALSTSGIIGCHRWNDNAPHVVDVRGDQAEVAYNVVLMTVREKGYHVVEEDEKRGFLKVRAKLDADLVVAGAGVVARVSYFSFQALPAGKLRVSASGYHVHDDDTKIHVRLDEELHSLLGAIERSATQVGNDARPPAAPVSSAL